MIRIKRDSVPEPESFIKRGRQAHAELAQFVKDLRKRKQVQRTLPFNEKLLVSDDLKEALIGLFRGACAFCESRLSISERQNVGHFRPKHRAAQLDGKVEPLHYWWLAYEWRNLYAICSGCLSNKGPRFPVKGRRAEYDENDPLSIPKEQALLLDPCGDEDPEAVLQFLEDGTVRSDSERGQITIDVFGLNRMELVNARRDHCELVDSVGNLFLQDNEPLKWQEDGFIGVVFGEMPSGSGYTALTRQQARRHLARAQQIAGKLGPSVAYIPPDVTRPYQGAVWLRKIQIENFKAVRHLELEFPPITAQTSSGDVDGVIAQSLPQPPSGEPWLMLLGENAVGKSSVLKAIALALMPPAQQRKYAPDAGEWVTHGSRSKSGMVRLEFTVGAQPLELHFSRKRKEFERRGDFPDVSVLGYGSTRLLPRSKGRRPRPERRRLQNLFDSRAPLRDAERWLAHRDAVKSRDFNLLATSLKTILSLGDEDRIARRDERLSATLFGKSLPIRSLSDGYQSVLALAIDMMLNLSKATFDMEGVEGVVLLDEIEVHLHPRWKIAIVGALRRLFPRVRFIVTTHDPLCVQGIRKGELHIMTRQGEDYDVKIEQFDVPPGSRADQILTGAWFGVPSTRDPETVAMMRMHSALLQNPAKTADDTRRLESLDRELRRRVDEYIGTEDEQIALQAAADFKAERHARTGKPGAASAAELHDKIIEALRSRQPGNQGA
jgi:uncharacterized protein (TIGR02646 family)